MTNEKKKLEAKASAKAATKQKLKRRRLLTFVRMVRYGVNNFSRNAWLTIAATAVMTITLLIMFTAAASHLVLTDTVGGLRDRVDMSIYLKTDTAEAVGEELRSDVLSLSTVRSVEFVSSEQIRDEIIQEHRNDNEMLDAIKEANNRNPAVLRIVVEDINNITELQNYVDTNEALREHLDENRPPSFAGERRSSIESIGRAVSFAQTAGIIASAIFVVISSLIIFNTIRMAIFNRKEEIYMMKLIGAGGAFIRGPFLVEAIMYGFIAALIATTLGIIGLFGLADALSGYDDVVIRPSIELVTNYAWLVLLAMIVAGAIIGILSSLFATRKYLKLS